MRRAGGGDARSAEGGWIVRGRVQGVGFRYWTLKEAERRGLAGTVENLPDGSVRVMARGAEDDVRAFAERLWEGPAFANVRAVDPVPCTLPAGVRDFSIER